MSAKMTVVAVVPAAYSAITAPEHDAEFVPTQIHLRADAGNFLFSFDGTNDHGLVKAADTNPVVIWTKQQKVWVKQSGGAAAARIASYTTS